MASSLSPMKTKSQLPGNKVADLARASVLLDEAAGKLNSALILLEAQGMSISYGKSVGESIELWAHRVSNDLDAAIKWANQK